MFSLQLASLFQPVLQARKSFASYTHIYTAPVPTAPGYGSLSHRALSRGHLKAAFSSPLLSTHPVAASALESCVGSTFTLTEL